MHCPRKAALAALLLGLLWGAPAFAQRGAPAGFPDAPGKDVLVAKCGRALEQTGARALNLGGGVACNRELRARLTAECEARGVALRIPSPRFCADNAAMIALLGAWMLARGDRIDPELDAAASLEDSGLEAAIP